MAPQLSPLERQVQERLDRASIRFTSGRRAVVRAMARAPGPESAADLHRRLEGRVPLSSLYRTLAVLEEAGVVSPHHSELTRYELSEWLAGHHHHVVCTGCGAVEDLRLSAATEDQLEGLVNAVAATAGFAPEDHSLEIAGRCYRCR